MGEPWMPSLTVHEQRGRCRLRLAGDAWGDGATLQEAADNLVARAHGGLTVFIAALEDDLVDTRDLASAAA